MRKFKLYSDFRPKGDQIKAIQELEEGLKKMNAKSLTGKMITPEEIAEIYSYFAMSILPQLSGVTLLSDGGITYLQ